MRGGERAFARQVHPLHRVSGTDWRQVWVERARAKTDPCSSVTLCSTSSATLQRLTSRYIVGTRMVYRSYQQTQLSANREHTEKKCKKHSALKKYRVRDEQARLSNHKIHGTTRSQTSPTARQGRRRTNTHAQQVAVRWRHITIHF